MFPATSDHLEAVHDEGQGRHRDARRGAVGLRKNRLLNQENSLIIRLISLIPAKNSLFCRLGNCLRESQGILGICRSTRALSSGWRHKFPVFSLHNREFKPGDGFARDWPLRHPIDFLLQSSWPAAVGRFAPLPMTVGCAQIGRQKIKLDAVLS